MLNGVELSNCPGECVSHQPLVADRLVERVSLLRDLHDLAPVHPHRITEQPGHHSATVGEDLRAVTLSFRVHHGERRVRTPSLLGVHTALLDPHRQGKRETQRHDDPLPLVPQLRQLQPLYVSYASFSRTALRSARRYPAVLTDPARPCSGTAAEYPRDEQAAAAGVARPSGFA